MCLCLSLSLLGCDVCVRVRRRGRHRGVRHIVRLVAVVRVWMGVRMLVRVRGVLRRIVGPKLGLAL